MPKVHNKPIERPRKGSNKGSKKTTQKAPWSGAPDCPVCHRTVSGAPPDSDRCTRGLQLKLASFGKLQRLVRYNSPDCPVQLRSNGYFGANGYLRRIYCALCARPRAEDRRAHTGAPDKEQCMSGVHRTSRRAHKSEAPMVRIQRQ